MYRRCNGKDSEVMKRRFSEAGEVSLHVHAVMYSTRRFVVSLNRKCCALRCNLVFIRSVKENSIKLSSNFYLTISSATSQMYHNHDTSVVIATGYGAGRPGLFSRKGKQIFLSSPQSLDRFYGRTILLSNGYQRQSLGIRRPGSEADNSLPSSAQVKNSGIIPPLPHTSSWYGA
jgi:hypothetical protein